MEIVRTAAISLLNADAVRSRAHQMLRLGLDDQLSHFRVDIRHLDRAVDRVLAITREAYPALDVPFHSRWRHFVSGKVDRWTAISDARTWPDLQERARAEFDLAIVSVFLDAGAGPAWRYLDPVTGMRLGRSEGLALAERAALETLLTKAKQGDPTTRARAWAEANLPTFIYYDDYGRLETLIHLPSFLARQANPDGAWLVRAAR